MLHRGRAEPNEDEDYHDGDVVNHSGDVRDDDISFQQSLRKLNGFLASLNQREEIDPAVEEKGLKSDVTSLESINTYKLTNEIFTLCLQSKLTEMKALIQQYNNNNNNNNNNKEQQQQQQQQKSLNLSYWSTIDMSLYKNQFMNNNYTINHFFTSLLHFAIISQSIEMIEYVLNELNFKTSINQQDLDGYTALTYAVIIGNIDIIQLLIEEYNADPTIISIHGEKLYHFALLTNNIDIIEYILSLTPIPFIECDNKDNNNNKDNKNNNKNNKNNNNNKMGQDDDEDDDEDDEDDEEQLPQLKLDDPLMETCIMKLASNASLISIDFLSFDLDIDLNFQNSILLKYAILSGSIELVDFLINEHKLEFNNAILLTLIDSEQWQLFKHFIEKHQCDIKSLGSSILHHIYKTKTITPDLIDYVVHLGIPINYLDFEIFSVYGLESQIHNYPVVKHLITHYDIKVASWSSIIELVAKTNYDHAVDLLQLISTKDARLAKEFLHILNKMVTPNVAREYIFDSILWNIKENACGATVDYILQRYSSQLLAPPSAENERKSTSFFRPKSINDLRQAIIVDTLNKPNPNISIIRTFIHKDYFIIDTPAFNALHRMDIPNGYASLLFMILHKKSIVLNLDDIRYFIEEKGVPFNARSERTGQTILETILKFQHQYRNHLITLIQIIDYFCRLHMNSSRYNDHQIFHDHTLLAFPPTLLRYLIPRYNIDVNKKYSRLYFTDQTLLHQIAFQHLDSTTAKSKDQISILVEYGADINAQDKNGAVPLGLAILTSNFDIAYCICDQKTTNLQFIDGKNQTFLHLAISVLGRLYPNESDGDDDDNDYFYNEDARENIIMDFIEDTFDEIFHRMLHPE